MSDSRPVGVAVVGAGYWGPNLIRNFSAHPACELRWVCDLDLDRARGAVGRYSTLRVTDSLDEVLGDPAVEAIAIATPAATHVVVAGAAFAAGKHVLVEKPLASSVEEGRKLVEMAAEADRVLMCDHTFCYTPVVRRIRELVDGGVLGDVQYVDSVRINLGLVQPDVDVFWDLAPHDLSILDFILPDDRRPVGVAAQGADPIGAGQGVRRIPHAPAPGRRDRARARELAESHQDPHDDRGRLGPDARLGRPAPDAAPQHVRQGRRPACRLRFHRGARPRADLATAPAISSRRRFPRARRSAAWWGSSPARSVSTGPR